MLAVTADIFSGRENPRWVLVDENEARDVLRKAARHRQALAPPEQVRPVLGFRGLVVELLDDSAAQRLDLPSEFRLAGGRSGDEQAGAELAEQLLERTPTEGEAYLSDAGPDEDARALALEMLREGPPDDAPVASASALPSTSVPPPGDEAGEDKSAEPAEDDMARAAAAGCQWIATPFNPGLWNNNPYVRRNNNCYNYACNRRTNTFAQPGRAAGQMYTQITCPAVGRGARADGNRIWGNCFPAGTGGLWIMALVMAPGQDYHWYRFMSSGYWTHKPGGTPATNRDNSGNRIRDPRTCNRGIYTRFCTFYQTAATVRIR
jgi:hypothetical protein